MQPEPYILHYNDVIVIASWRDFFWYAWRQRATARDAARLVDAHRSYLDQHPTGRTLALARVMPPAMHPPDEGMRAEFRRHVEVAKEVGAIATVIDGGGFAAALTRGLISSLTLLSSHPAPHRVTGTLREGLSFLLEHREASDDELSLDELVRAYHSAMPG